MTPTLVLKDGKPAGHRQPRRRAHHHHGAAAVVNHIDFGMNPAEAAATPRFHHQWTPDELRVEKASPRHAGPAQAMGPQWH
jgi:gamma-glutamyltranspeptidase/glutathione hydrolase